jgi:hypothetical protein
MKQLLQHTPVPTPVSKESMESFKGVKGTKQMQQELEKGTPNDLAQVTVTHSMGRVGGLRGGGGDIKPGGDWLRL